MGALLHHLKDQNATATALRKAFPAVSDWQAEKVIPFSSARKWSGVSFKNQGSFAFGAPEFIFKEMTAEMQSKIQPYLEEGQRVLVLVEYPGTLEEELVYEPRLLATLIISDNLRENAQATFGYFAKQEIKPGDLYEFLGAPEYTRDKYQGNEYAGVVTGLAWTAVGGEILFVETSFKSWKRRTSDIDRKSGRRHEGICNAGFGIYQGTCFFVKSG